MKKFILITLLVLLIVIGGGTVLRGQAPAPAVITIRQPQPEVLVVNLATPVKIAAVITGDVLHGGVSLVRLGANGGGQKVLTFSRFPEKSSKKKLKS